MYYVLSENFDAPNLKGASSHFKTIKKTKVVWTSINN